MERMASEVRECLKTANFGGKPLISQRGLKSEDFLFDDEASLKNF